MDTFVKKLKRKQWLNVAGVVAAGGYIGLFLIQKFDADGTAFEGFFYGFQLGILAAMIGYLVYDWVKTHMALRNDEKLKSLYIEETDERKKMIERELGKMASRMSYFGLIFAAIVSGFYNETVFSTLVAVLLGLAAIQIFGKVYYNRKF